MTRLLFAALIMVMHSSAVASELTPLFVDGVAEFGPEVSRADACKERCQLPSKMLSESNTVKRLGKNRF